MSEPTPSQASDTMATHRSRVRIARSRHLPVIGRSLAMQATLALVDHACASTATVLLTGETGTGKEVLARAVHSGSPRADEPFVALNCAAFPDTLLESELFGHVKGAFTGADRSKEGLFALASGGTLFLDEIGETSLALQAKLLRVLQEREVRPIGGTRARKIDVRLVAATNRELRTEIHAKRFRSDLYYRLAVFPIPVPPLRERRDDVLELARHFLALHGRREGRPGVVLSPDAGTRLVAHHWPGNVRELENEMHRALVLCGPDDVVHTGHLSAGWSDAEIPDALLEPATDDEPLRETLARIETFLIQRTLDAYKGHRADTARALGLTREGLWKKMKRLGIG